MPLSFQGLRYPLPWDSRLASDALDALLEACLNNELGELDPFLRRSSIEVKDDMLPGLRSLSKKPDCSAGSSPKCERVGESVVSTGGSAL